MTTEDTTKRGRGRPKKIKLTPKAPKPEVPAEPFGPKKAADIFVETVLDDETSVSIFGIDDFTEELIERLWLNPHISTIYCSDTSQERLNLINKKIGSRSFSMWRWKVRPVQDFLQLPKTRLCAVASGLKDRVGLLKSQGIQIVVLEELNVD